MAYNLRTNEILLHGKFQPPNFNGVAVHRSQTEVQTKRGLSNICLDAVIMLQNRNKLSIIENILRLDSTSESVFSVFNKLEILFN